MEAKFSHIFIATKDFEKSVSLYRDALGFEEVGGWGHAGEPKGSILHLGEFQIIIAEEHAARDSSWTHGVAFGKPTIHIKTTSFDDLFARSKAKGCVVVPPEKTHWGAEWFVFQDFEGNLIAVTKDAEV